MPKRKKNVIVGNATIVCPHCGFDNGVIGHTHPVLGAAYMMPCGQCRKALTYTLRLIYEVGAISVTMSAADSKTRKPRTAKPEPELKRETATIPASMIGDAEELDRDEALQRELDDLAEKRRLKKANANLPPEL